MQSGSSSVEALTLKKRLELRLLTLWYLVLKNLWVGKVQVLAAATTACNAQAILENFYRYKTISAQKVHFWEVKKMKTWSGSVLFCWKSMWVSFFLGVGVVVKFESWNRERERGIERFLFSSFLWWILSGLLVDCNLFRAHFGLDLDCFIGTEKKVGFCKVVFFLWVGVMKPSCQKISISVQKIWNETSYIKTRWRIWLGYFGRDLACTLCINFNTLNVT